MKINKKRVFTYLIFACFLFLPAQAFLEEGNTNNLFDIKGEEIEISSDSFEVKDSTVSFEGNVSAVSGDMKIDCQTLMLYFKESLKDAFSDNKKPQIDKIIASESVKITGPDLTAIAEKVVYYHDTEKIVLTGNPLIKHGEDNFGGGGKITVYLKEGQIERIVVERSEKSPAKLKFKLEG